jgi:hypothetical protein
MSHYHVIAGDLGYLPIYNEGIYDSFEEAFGGLTEYVETTIDQVEVDEHHPAIRKEDCNSTSDYWLKTSVVGVVFQAYEDDPDSIRKVGFDREVVSIDYAEIVQCFEPECRKIGGLTL